MAFKFAQKQKSYNNKCFISVYLSFESYLFIIITYLLTKHILFMNSS